MRIKVKGKKIKARKVGPGKDTIYIGFDARLEVVKVEWGKRFKEGITAIEKPCCSCWSAVMIFQLWEDLDMIYLGIAIVLPVRLLKQSKVLLLLCCNVSG